MDSPLRPGEVCIHDGNYLDHLAPLVDGEIKGRGCYPRNWVKQPFGCFAWAPPFTLPIIDPSHRQALLDARVANKAQLSNIRDRGNGGQPIPSRDQNGKGYSHTADTEVLTEKGWVQWPDWNRLDLLASVNTATGLMEFQAPTEWHAYEYDDETYHSTNRRLDFGVTRNHRMLVRKWDERRRTLSDEYTFQRADELGWYVGMMAAPSGFIGTELIEVAPEGNSRRYDGDDFLAMLAVICSDGFAGSTENTRNLVSFCCFREDRYAAVAALARRTGFEEQASRRGVWKRYDPELASWLKANCYLPGQPLRSPFKKVPEIVKWASSRQIKHFLQFFGDKNHAPGAQPAFYSSSKRMADDLQELLLRVGKRGTIRDRGPRRGVIEATGQVVESGPSHVLTVSETDRLCIDRKKHIETDHYKGLVYCATVPNGTLVTRRNGSVLISGNCWAHSGVSAHLLARAAMNEPYADLSAYAVACVIKQYRDEGGWGSEGIEFQASRGCPTSAFWPQQSMAKSNDKPETWADAAKHRYLNWMELDPQQMEDQKITCLLLNIPLIVDFNWWSHSVCGADLVNVKGDLRIWNSWGDSWSAQGMGVLEGSKARPDGAWACVLPTVSSETVKRNIDALLDSTGKP